jgi:hypothetical protein
MPDQNVEQMLNQTSDVLSDTIRLGEAMLVEFSEQGESLTNAKTHTASIVKQAKQAEHTVRSMRSTPYALWRWCIEMFQWMVSGVFISPSPALETVSNECLKKSSSSYEKMLHSTTTPLEAQVSTLLAQAHAMGEALDTHLHLLDEFDKTVNTCSTQLHKNDQSTKNFS